MNKAAIIYGANYGENVDSSRWVVIYPPYIDSTKTEKQGRRIAKEKCVKEPNMREIFDCACLLKLPTGLEPQKAYPRDYWQIGRIRVRLFDDDGKPIREDIPNRKALFANVAKLIPEHRKQIATKQKPTSSNKSTNKAAKPSDRKGAPPPPKKKKKGKR